MVLHLYKNTLNRLILKGFCKVCCFATLCNLSQLAMVKQDKSKSSKKTDASALSMVSAKGQEKSNPWNDTQVLSGADASLAHSNAQSVQNMPDILANDKILAAILQPRTKGPIKIGKLSNVTPLKVSYGGTSTEQPGGGSLVKEKVHKKQQVEYDSSKGFVSTSWANFLMDPEKAKESPMTTHKSGLFIRHVTSTALNPNDPIFKGKGGKGKGKKGKLQGGVPPSVNVESLSYTNSSLLSNTWTNVIMYQPKEQIFKINQPPGSPVQKSLSTSALDQKPKK